MCGRAYATYTDEELELRYLNQDPPSHWRVRSQIPNRSANFNLSPTQRGVVLGVFEGTLEFREMRWGLVPAWAKSIKDASKYSLINARSEEISEKRSYRAAFQKRRCILPLSGFFEWQRNEEGEKHPFAISLAHDPIMSIAAVWEHWESKESGESVNSFSLLTTSANTFMQNIHDRMPVILNRNDERLWLDPAVQDPATLQPLLKPYPSSALKSHEVWKLVNSPHNNSVEVLRAVGTELMG